jgi:tetratricopeptide (TPR) repeat protein
MLPPLLFAVPAQPQTPKPAMTTHPQSTADAAARKQLAAYLAEYRSDPSNADLRDKIIELAKTLKPAPLVPQAARTEFAKAMAQLKAAATPGDDKVAAAAFEQVAAQAPWYADAYFNAASAYAKAGDLSNAKLNLALYNSAVRPGVSTAAADTLQSEIDRQQAEIARQKAEAERQQAQQQFQQALQAFQKNPSDSARESLIKLAQSLPSKPQLPGDVIESIGGAAYAVKNATSDVDLIAAAEAYKKASLLAPWVPDYYFNQGVAYEKAKRYDDAIAAFNWYLMAAPTANDADSVRERIGGLKYAKQREAEKANVNAQLAEAIHWVKPDQFRALIERGADVNTQDSNHWTALTIAVGFGTEDLVRYLLDRGADVNYTWCCSSCGINHCGGHTLLMEAAWSLKPSLVQLFIRRGLPLNARDSSGRSAVKWAEENSCGRFTQEQVNQCQSDRAEVIRILREAGGTE